MKHSLRKNERTANQLIAEEIKLRNLTYESAALYFGKSFQCVGQWVNGSTKPNDTTLLKLIDSPHEWVSDLAFRCLVMRYPVIVQLLVAKGKETT